MTLDMQTYSVNRAAAAMIDDAIARAGELQIKAWRAECGAMLVDMGLTCPGSWKAGQVFVEAGFGGLGKAAYGTFDLDPFLLPSIEVWVDHPVIAVVASQAGCWELGEGALYSAPSPLYSAPSPLYSAPYAEIGSGPARAVALADRWSGSGYRDREAERVVVQLQTRRIPDDDLCRFVADACHVRPDQVYVVFAPTACLVGAIQVASRTVEQVMVKLFLHGFDIHTVRHGFGVAPVAPLAADEGEAMGRVNDCLFYGATTVLYADAPDAAIESVIGKLCFDVNAGEFWGMPFAQIFDRFGRNWFAVPDLLDSPAKVIINSLQTGHSFAGGQINREALRQSFFGGGAF